MRSSALDEHVCGERGDALQGRGVLAVALPHIPVQINVIEVCCSA